MTLKISKLTARRTLLAHQGLLSFQFSGKAGVVDFIRRVGCIQFDPIDAAGRNPDLVLQARVAGYRREMLAELLYQDRLLLDGWDKMAAIYGRDDWRYFSRFRDAARRHHSALADAAMKVAPYIRQEIRQRGTLSSIDLDHDKRIQGYWGRQARLVSVSLDVLFSRGELGIHRRMANRRYFDLMERLIPPEVLSAPDPNLSDEDYQDWHVLRRVGGMGLAMGSGSSDCWLGIHGVKTAVRQAAFKRLVEKNELVAVEVEDIPNNVFYLRSTDLPNLEQAQNGDGAPPPRALFLAPLDNLIWNRNLPRLIFDFDYTWEIYKPAAQRKYGYYTLPVLYGDRFIARFAPVFDKKTRTLTISNWWWENGIQPDDSMHAALSACFSNFMRYLDAAQMRAGDAISGDKFLEGIITACRDA